MRDGTLHLGRGARVGPLLRLAAWSHRRASIEFSVDDGAADDNRGIGLDKMTRYE